MVQGDQAGEGDIKKSGLTCGYLDVTGRLFICPGFCAHNLQACKCAALGSLAEGNKHTGAQRPYRSPPGGNFTAAFQARS